MFVFFFTLCLFSICFFFFYKFNGKALSCLKLPFTLCFLRPEIKKLLEGFGTAPSNDRRDGSSGSGVLLCL